MEKRYLLFTLLISTLSFAQLPIPGDEIFINELHYDNDGTDSNEGVEIAGPAGTDLSDYTVYFYRDIGTVYATEILSGIIPDQENGFGTLWFPVTGIQNGSNDGIVLYNEVSGAMEIISYEGTFTATDGVANGNLSTDIGVSESTTSTIGNSLQLIGTGNVRNDFSWTGPIVDTPGDINSGQTFSAVASLGTNKLMGFTVYPNPITNGNFKINSANGNPKQLSVFDMLGKQVFSKNVRRNEEIRVDHLNPGIYILKVEEEGKVATRKLVIE